MQLLLADQAHIQDPGKDSVVSFIPSNYFSFLAVSVAYRSSPAKDQTYTSAANGAAATGATAETTPDPYSGIPQQEL